MQLPYSPTAESRLGLGLVTGPTMQAVVDGYERHRGFQEAYLASSYETQLLLKQ